MVELELKNKISLSVVVPTYHRPKMVEQLLLNILEQSMLPDEIIIVDASEDGETKAVCDALQTKSQSKIVYVKSVKGLTIQRDVGIKSSRGNFVLMLDDDVILDENCIEHLVLFLSNPDNKEIGGVSAYIVNQWGKDIDNLWFRFLKKIGFFPKEIEAGKYLEWGFPVELAYLKLEGVFAYTDFLPGGSTLWKREVLNYYKPNVDIYTYGGEDKEFSLRVGRKYKLAVLKKAKIVHYRSEGGAREKSFITGYYLVRNIFYIARYTLKINNCWAKMKLILYLFLDSLRIALSGIKHFDGKTFSKAGGILLGVIMFTLFKPRKKGKKNILMWGREKLDPASRFRLVQYIEPLENLGYLIRYVSPFPSGNFRLKRKHNKIVFWGVIYLIRFTTFLDTFVKLLKAPMYDIIFLNRDILPFLKKPFLEMLLKKLNSNIIFDFDDAIFYNSPEEKIAKVIRNSKCVTVGNKYLYDFAKRFNDKVIVLPTVVDTDKIRPDLKKDDKLEFIIGWIGSDNSYESCFSEKVKNVLRNFLKSHINTRLFIVKETMPPEKEWENLNWTFKKWSIKTEKEILSLLDVGIMPLEDNQFQRGKCGGKLLLYMAAAVPVIASSVGINSELIINGQNGFLASDSEEWLHALETIYNDKERGKKMGRIGREFVEKNCSVKSVLFLLDSILDGEFENWRREI